MRKEVCNKEDCRNKTTCYRWWANIYFKANMEALGAIEMKLLSRLSIDMAKTLLEVTAELADELLDGILWYPDKDCQEEI